MFGKSRNCCSVYFYSFSERLVSSLTTAKNMIFLFNRMSSFPEKRNFNIICFPQDFGSYFTLNLILGIKTIWLSLSPVMIFMSKELFYMFCTINRASLRDLLKYLNFLINYIISVLKKICGRKTLLTFKKSFETGKILFSSY